jgi:hypothetical protein
MKDFKGKEVSKDLSLKMAHRASMNNLACFVPNIFLIDCPKKEGYPPLHFFKMKSGSNVII